jgi:hypothetical protein
LLLLDLIDTFDRRVRNNLSRRAFLSTEWANRYTSIVENVRVGCEAFHDEVTVECNELQ